MVKDVVDDKGNKIGEDHRQDNIDSLDKFLSNYPEAQKIIMPLIQNTSEVDLTQENRHRKGDDVAKRVSMNEKQLERVKIFMDNTNHKAKHLDEKETEYWLKKGSEYDEQIKKIEDDDMRNKIQDLTNVCLGQIITAVPKVFDENGNPLPYGDTFMEEQNRI